MKDIFMIGGTMGVGKSTVSKILKQKLGNSVFLDGDWCWDMHPFIVTDETRQMVMSNICFLLNSFIHCSAYDNIIFCWVMHQQSIIDDILSNLDLTNCLIHNISLICSPAALEKRLKKDIEAGGRAADILPMSLARIPLYAGLKTVKIDSSDQTAEQTAEDILSRYGRVAKEMHN